LSELSPVNEKMQILYSETILLFLKKAKSLAFSILQNEMHLKCGRTRFYHGKIGYPLQLVLFEHPSKLGYFDSEMYEIGINKCFLFEKEEKLRQLLQHELAHYLTFIQHGKEAAHHGKEFRSICASFGFAPKVSLAKTSSETHQKSLHLVKKVEKLLALSESHNEHEAEAALLKAHSLLLKHGLCLTSSSSLDEEMALTRLFKRGRIDAKLRTIASILRHFFIYPIFNQGNKCSYLEILGTPCHVEIATYIGHFLDRELDRLWKSSALKGQRAKHSFFSGIAKGYESKMELSSEAKQALIPLERQLTKTAEEIYPHLSSRSSRGLYDPHAHKKGKEAGKNMQIKAALSSQNKSTLRLKFPL